MRFKTVFILILLSLAVIVIIYYQVSHRREIPMEPTSSSAQMILEENCPLFYGPSGEGFASFPPVRDTELNPEAKIFLVYNRAAEMPDFSNMKEPDLCLPAEYIHKF